MTTVYAVVSSNNLFAISDSGNRYHISSGTEKQYWLDADATTVMNHMNTEYPEYTWTKEAGPALTVDQLPGSIDTPVSRTEPQWNCHCYKIINGVKYYVKDMANKNDLDSDIANACNCVMTRQEIKQCCADNEGLSVDLISRV